MRTAAETHQAELDAAAAAARQAHIATARAAALAGVSPDSSAYPVCALVAQTLTIGRKGDEYPEMFWPDTTKAVVFAAVRAKILIRVGEIKLYDGCGIPCSNPGFDPDYLAWDAAKTYRDRQIWTAL